MVQSLDDFTANPDMVEEFFYLAARFVGRCPDPLISRCAEQKEEHWLGYYTLLYSNHIDKTRTVLVT